jgi:hypothetical protein
MQMSKGLYPNATSGHLSASDPPLSANVNKEESGLGMLWTVLEGEHHEVPSNLMDVAVGLVQANNTYVDQSTQLGT